MILDESYQGENLVFLVGCPRSGTTWLQRMLSSHRSVVTGQETHLFNFYIGPQLRQWQKLLNPDTTGRGGVGMGCYVSEQEFISILRGYLLSLLQPILRGVDGNQLFLEKSPAHALYIPEIRQLLPKARFIHILRDPRDVVSSLLSAANGWGRLWAPGNARAAARTWVQHVEAVRRSAVNLQPWEFIEVSYEALYADPLAGMRKLVDFLGVEWTDEELRRSVHANSADEARKGGGTAIPVGGAFATRTGTVEEPAGFVRRGHPGGWRQDLTWGQRRIVNRLTSRLMNQL